MMQSGLWLLLVLGCWGSFGAEVPASQLPGRKLRVRGAEGLRFEQVNELRVRKAERRSSNGAMGSVEVDELEMFIVKTGVNEREQVRQILRQDFGVGFLSYIPSDAFLVSLTREQAESVAAETKVAGVYIMPTEMKTPPNRKHRETGHPEPAGSKEVIPRVHKAARPTRMLLSDSTSGTESPEAAFVDVLLGVPGTAVVQRWQSSLSSKGLGCESLRIKAGKKNGVSVELKGCSSQSIVEWIAEQKEVVWVAKRSEKGLRSLGGRVKHQTLEHAFSQPIAPEMRKHGLKEVQSPSNPQLRHKFAIPAVLGESDSASSSLIWSKGLQGSGQIIGVADTGVDYDNCLFSDTDGDGVGLCGYGQQECSEGTVSTRHRKIVSYRLHDGTGNVEGDADGHGTHVAGSIAGSAPTSAPSALQQNSGIAPGAKLAVDDFPSSSGGLSVPGNLYEDLWQFSHDTGARVHSNSWGDSSTEYTLDAFYADQFSWDHPDFLIVFAAGNDGPSPLTTGSPATAKNVLSVGASENNPAAYQESATRYMRLDEAPQFAGAWVEIVPADGFGTSPSLDNPLMGELAPIDPFEGCSAATNDVSGKIVLVYRGSCYFHEKALTAMNAGAIAVIVVNNRRWQPAIVMGAVEGLDPVTIPSYMISYDEGALLWEMASASRVRVELPISETGSLDNLAYFSSQGPTPDMRFSPLVVAPGDLITSARSDGDLFSENCDADSALMSMSGTSMAAPIAAGSAAIVRQYFEQGFQVTGSQDTSAGVTPSAALVRAMLLHSGRALNYWSEDFNLIQAPSLPSFEQGFGSINLKSVLWFGEESDFGFFYADRTPLSTSDMVAYCFDIEPGNSLNLKITISYTDHPSTFTTQKALVNDLDLDVITPSNRYLLGNSKKDSVNNHEQVVLESPTAGQYKARISGFDVPMGPQEFAIVMTGGFSSVRICDSVECQGDCSGNGQCVTGKCICDAAFSGDDCSIPNVALNPQEAAMWTLETDAWQYFDFEQADSSSPWDIQVSGIQGLVGVLAAWNRVPTLDDSDFSGYSFDLDVDTWVGNPRTQSTSTILLSSSTATGTRSVSSTSGSGKWVVGIYSFCCLEASGEIQAAYTLPSPSSSSPSPSPSPTSSEASGSAQESPLPPASPSNESDSGAGEPEEPAEGATNTTMFWGISGGAAFGVLVGLTYWQCCRASAKSNQEDVVPQARSMVSMPQPTFRGILFNQPPPQSFSARSEPVQPPSVQPSAPPFSDIVTATFHPVAMPSQQ
mmetsp:Transcript_29223/g.45765  ORF Transcript_29223/g.45765 Transcript_29223/m.45765 type:complete len:1255 (+) Transcript_29223:84-3848(+)